MKQIEMLSPTTIDPVYADCDVSLGLTGYLVDELALHVEDEGRVGGN